MSQCTCGRGFTVKVFTDDPKMDSLCPACKEATKPLHYERDYTLAQLTEAYFTELYTKEGKGC